jgi:ABC-type antimicrobial peptide transport system permease subunit
LVLGQGLGQVLLGLIIGAGAALWFARLVEPWLFATRASDPRIMAAAGLIFGLAAIAASWMPARRASSVDPLVLLKLE